MTRIVFALIGGLTIVAYCSQCAFADPKVIPGWNLYEDFGGGTCIKGTCSLYFKPVTGTDGQDSAEITHITCRIFIVSNQGDLVKLEFGQGNSDQNSFTAARFLAPVTTMSFAYGGIFYQASATIAYPVAAGTSPVVQARYTPATAATQLLCSIAGPHK